MLSAFTSCQDEWQQESPPDGLARIDVSASIFQQTTTRADESGFAGNDKIGVFVVNYNGDAPGVLTLSSNHVNNVGMVLDSGSGKWNPVTDIYWADNSTHADIYGYYPFENNFSDINGYPFEVSANQSKAGDDGDMSDYEASDFLWAKASDSAPGSAVNLTFRHRMAGVKVVLEEGSGFSAGEFDKLAKVVAVEKTTRQSLIDLSDGTVTPAGSPDRNIIMKPDDGCFRAVVVPQTVEAGLPTLTITLDGITYPFTRQEGMTYASGKLHNFTICIDKKENEGKYILTLADESITPWEADNTSHDFEANSYLVVKCKGAGLLRESMVEMGVDIATVRNLKVEGDLNEEDCRLMRDDMPVLSAVNLKDATFPYSLIGFEHGPDISYYQENAIPMGAFQNNKTIRRFILPESVTEIGPEAFAGTEPTSMIVIPESVVKIGVGAFQYIWENGEIALPGKLERIERDAFYHSSAKLELRLPSTLKYIGDHAFEGASGVYGNFSLPHNLEYLGVSAFSEMGHDMTGDIVIPSGVTEDVTLGIGFANGTNITIPEGVRSIGRLGGKYNSQIILPKSLERIEYQAFYCTKLTGGIELPENLVYIASRAFLESNLSGTLRLPDLIDCVKSASFNYTQLQQVILGDNILQIEEEAFGRNYELRYVELGKNIQFIGQHAFSECPQIQTFVCLAKEPPSAKEAFTSCDFDKTVVEVPTGCVDIYRHADGWKDFKNITEHRELAFDIPEIECLHKGVTIEGIIRAESAWSVTECPEWIHVSPMESNGKDNLTISVNPQGPEDASREGEIVFTLKGKGYKTSTTVRQLHSEFAEDTEVVLQTATSSGMPIPLVIVGEGFTASQIVSGVYMRIMNETYRHFFDIEPYKSLRDHFTVTAAVACSPEKGVNEYGDNKTIKFDTYEVTPDVSKVRKYIREVSPDGAGANISNALVIVVANRDSFSGWSEISGDGFSIACVGHTTDGVAPYDFRGLIQHHAGGAAFAGLGYESVSHFENIKGCHCPNCNAMGKFLEMKGRGFFANLTNSGKISDSPWADFIFNPKYSADVDMWEGGYNHLRGVWRCESQSVMGTFIPYFNVISRYAIYQEVMRRSSLPASLEDFIANDKIEKPE